MLVFSGHLLFSLRSSWVPLSLCKKVIITVLCSHHQQSLWRDSTECGSTTTTTTMEKGLNRQKYFKLKARLGGLFGKWLPKQLHSL